MFLTAGYRHPVIPLYLCQSCFLCASISLSKFHPDLVPLLVGSISSQCSSCRSRALFPSQVPQKANTLGTQEGDLVSGVLVANQGMYVVKDQHLPLLPSPCLSPVSQGDRLQGEGGRKRRVSFCPPMSLSLRGSRVPDSRSHGLLKETLP